MAGQTISVTVLADTKNFTKQMQGLGKNSGLDKLGRQFKNAGKAVGGFMSAGVKAGGAAAAGFGAVAAAATGAVGAVAALGIKMAASSKQSQKAFAGLKKHVLDGMMKAVKPLVPVLVGLAKQLGTLFDKVQPALSAIFKQLAPLIDQFAGKAVKAIGALIPPFLQLVKAAMPVIGVLGDALMPIVSALTPILSTLAKIVKTAIVPVFKSVVGIVVQLLPFIGKLITSLAKTGGQILQALLPALQSIFKALTPLAPVIGKLVASLAPILPLVAKLAAQLITALVPVLVPLVKLVAKVAAAFGKALIAAFKALMPALLSIVKAVTSLLPALMPLIPALLKVVTAVLPLIPAIVKLAALLLNALMPVLLPLVTALVKLGTVILGKVAKAITWLVSGFTKHVVPAIKSFLTSMTNAKEGISKLWGALTGLKDKVIGWAKAAIDWLKSAGSNLVKGLKNGITSAYRTITSWLSTHVKQPVIDWISNAAHWLVSSGKDLVTGLKNGIVSIFRTIDSWLYYHVKKPVIDWISNAAHWLVSAGKHVVGGLQSGIVDVFKTISSWLYWHVKKPILDWISSAASWLVSAGKHVVTGLKNGVVDGYRGISGWLYRHVKKPIIDYVSGAVGWLKSAGKHVISGLKNGVVDAMKGIVGWLRSHLWDPIKNGVKSLFGIHSPSSEFEWFGSMMIKGLINGLIKGNAGSFVKKVFGGVTDEAKKALKYLVKHGYVAASELSGAFTGDTGSLARIGAWVAGLFGGGGGSAPADVSGAKAIGKKMAAARGWTGSQWDALYHLWMGESGWNPFAQNPTSGAYGIPQSLPGSKMASAGADWRTNPVTQILWGLRYIAARYGNPMRAYTAWLARMPHWYATGTGNAPGGWAWVGERGRELMRVPPGSQILDHKTSEKKASQHERETVIAPNITINNPTGEPSAVSLNRGLSKAAALGMFG